MARSMSLMQAHTRPVTRRRLLGFVVAGFAVGLVVGHLFMGTAHAVLEQRARAGRGAAPAGGRPAGAGGGQRRSTQEHQQAVFSQQQQQQQQQQQEGEEAVGETARLRQRQQRDTEPATIHTLCPSNGSPYQNYQMRIAYATYKLILGMPGGERHTGFTRILHRTQPDILMQEVPTFRANPLQPECDNWCAYPVSDRANAVRQFLEAARADASLIKGNYIYMIESDYVFMRPLSMPPPPDSVDARADGWAFEFKYIQPEQHRPSMAKLYSGAAQDIPQTGPAPVLLRREIWDQLTPEWERLAAVIEADEGMRKELGWVREMYGFSAALAQLKLELHVWRSPLSPFIVQLPLDSELGNAHAFHYTQCTIYKSVSEDKEVWGFDKRFFTKPENVTNIQQIPLPPQHCKGCFKFVEGNPVTLRKHMAIVAMIEQMNRAIATLQPLSGAASS